MPGAGRTLESPRDDARPGPPPQPTPPGAGMSRERWMALCFALGSTCFLVGPFPGYVEPRRGPGGGRGDVLRRLDPLHAGGGAADLARGARAAARRGRPGRVVGGGRPVRRHAVLQRDDVPGAAHRRPDPQYDRLVWRPDAFGSVCFLVSGAIAYRASAAARRAAGPRRPGLVAAGRQPARLRLLRRSRPWPATSSRRRLDARPRRRELEHRARGRVLPRLRARPRCAPAARRRRRACGACTGWRSSPSTTPSGSSAPAASTDEPRPPRRVRRHDAHLVPGAAGAPAGTSS